MSEFNFNHYEGSTNFDFESIYMKEEGAEEIDYLQESIVLNSLLNFIAPKRFKKDAALARLFAVIWICRPHYFNGNPNITQKEVADILGTSKQIFNAHVSAFRKKYDFYVGGMRHDDARAKFSEICTQRKDELAESRRKSAKKNDKDTSTE